MSDFNSIFNAGKRYSIGNDDSVGNSREYRVHYSKGKDGIYTSLIRFIVNPRVPTNSIVSKYVSWLTDPVTGKPHPYDNPRSISADYNPIDKMFWYYFNCGDAVKKDTVKKLIRTSQQHSAIIQIVEDKNRPELCGKFMIFTFGKKIQDMIDAEYNGNAYMPGRDPFDVFKGRVFMLQCVNQGGNNNYDQSKFIDMNGGGMLYETGQRDVNGNPVLAAANPNTEGIQQFLYNYLMERTPVLEDYAYKPWDSATEDAVNNTLNNISSAIEQPTGNSFATPVNAVYSSIQAQGAPAPTTVMGMMEAQNVAAQPSQQIFQQKAPAYQPVQEPAFQTTNIAQAPVPEVSNVPQSAPASQPVNQFGDLSEVFGGF